ncbi:MULTISPECIES: hypothetical protein [unclassified Roseovarius]|uniref:hypothetical protein n=1 Tax=unclassified Roseovarius TaxID=2614913 RepID=UPI00273E9C3D|nr:MULTISPECIES: hypothetical protein [unclassified Roseovarius]
MLSTAQRIDILKIAVDLAKTARADQPEQESQLSVQALEIYRSLKAEIEKANLLEDADMSDVKTALNLASSIDGLIE